MRHTMQLFISAVDGERGYSIQTPDKAEALKFLNQYDHEGSSIQLEIDGADIFNSETIYKILSEK